IVLVLGRIAVRKGIEDGVAAAHMLSERNLDVKLRIVGGPGLWSDYTKLLEDLPQESSEYGGRIPPSETLEELERADLLLQVSKYEPFALTVAEALAAGVPVVASSEVGAIEGVDSGVVIEVAPSDVEGIVAAIAAMLERVKANPSATRSLARAEAERLFAPEVVSRGISAALEQLLATRSGAGKRHRASCLRALGQLGQPLVSAAPDLLVDELRLLEIAPLGPAHPGIAPAPAHATHERAQHRGARRREGRGGAPEVGSAQLPRSKARTVVVDGPAVDPEEQRIGVLRVGPEHFYPGRASQLERAQQVAADVAHARAPLARPRVAGRPVARQAAPGADARHAEARMRLHVADVLGAAHSHQRRAREALFDQRHRVGDRKGIAVEEHQQIVVRGLM